MTVEGGRGIVTDAGKRAGTVTVEGSKGHSNGCGGKSGHSDS